MDTRTELKLECLEHPLEMNARRQLAAFIDEAYAGRSEHKFPDRFDWLYGLTGGRHFIARHDGRIVGHVGAVPFIALASETGVCRGHWSVDTIVLPRMRGQGLGLALQRAAASATPLFLSVWMSPGNMAIKRRLGAVEIGTFTTLQRPVLARAFGTASNGSHPIDPAMIAAAAARFLPTCAFRIARSLEYCIWRFKDQPNAGYFQVSASDGLALARLCGPKRKGVLMVGDVLCEGGATAEVATRVACSVARPDIDTVVFGTAEPEVVSDLESRGWSIHSRMPVLALGTASTNFCYPLHLSMSDQDMDQFPW